ncbi:hypothetical protein ACFQ60_06735 [Streptomyces zhihengii]
MQRVVPETPQDLRPVHADDGLGHLVRHQFQQPQRVVVTRGRHGAEDGVPVPADHLVGRHRTDQAQQPGRGAETEQRQQRLRVTRLQPPPEHPPPLRLGQLPRQGEQLRAFAGGELRRAEMGRGPRVAPPLQGRPHEPQPARDEDLGQLVPAGRCRAGDKAPGQRVHLCPDGVRARLRRTGLPAGRRAADDRVPEVEVGEEGVLDHGGVQRARRVQGVQDACHRLPAEVAQRGGHQQPQQRHIGFRGGPLRDAVQRQPAEGLTAEERGERRPPAGRRPRGAEQGGDGVGGGHREGGVVQRVELRDHIAQVGPQIPQDPVVALLDPAQHRGGQLAQARQVARRHRRPHGTRQVPQGLALLADGVGVDVRHTALHRRHPPLGATALRKPAGSPARTSVCVMGVTLGQGSDNAAAGQRRAHDTR